MNAGAVLALSRTPCDSRARMRMERRPKVGCIYTDINDETMDVVGQVD
jgi:hypothetical protein